MNEAGILDNISAEPVPCEDGYVYMFYSAGLMKIGFTSDLSQRLDKLAAQSSTPIQFVWAARGDRRDEGDLHKKFKSDRRHGEWFSVSDGIREYLALADSMRVDGWSSLKALECAEITWTNNQTLTAG